MTISTNRDFYLFVTDLAERREDSARSLEIYLRALLRLSEGIADLPAIPLEHLASLLDAAFDSEPAPFDEAWRTRQFVEWGWSAYDDWRRTLLEQIVDLREMDEVGSLKNDHRYFGISAPSGSSWYNFDPLTYIECATEGCVGGWQPGDPGGRALLPGEVAVLDDRGEIVSVSASEVERPTFDLPSVSWEDFARFLWCGEHYE